ncbi:MAG: hypothetical protein II939_02725 [Bacteroidales bacterium]|nr:hypothetical protein [Bacteroidales bacterium]
MGKPVVVLSNNDGCVVARSNDVHSYYTAPPPPPHRHQLHLYFLSLLRRGDIQLVDGIYVIITM